MSRIENIKEIVDPTQCHDWNRHIAALPDNSFFHTANWARVLKESYSYKPVYFTGYRGPGLSLVIPLMEIHSPLTSKRGVSIPFTDYCEPIASDKDEFFAALARIIQQGQKAGWKYLEFRGGAKYFEDIVPYRTYVGHSIRTDREESELFNCFTAATKRNIRKSERSGVRVIVSDSNEALDNYYALHCLTRKRKGVPPQPRNFFEAIHRNVISEGRGFTILGFYGDRAIAGAVYMHSARKAVYKYGASDFRYQNLRANNMVMWEAIRWFSRNGFEELCLGRTDLEDAGLIRFKDGWGTRREVLQYYRYDFRKSCFSKSPPGMTRAAKRLFRMLPVPVLRLAGTLMYKHLG